MKLMVGLGSLEDYEAYVEAGADGFFIGYVPGDWMDRFGEHAPLNRREVLYYNVQIGSYSELLILQDMVSYYKVPVAVAINAIHFSQEQINAIPEIVGSCMDAGFTEYIVADENLWKLLSQEFGERIHLHLSGEFGELNQLVLKKLSGPALKRVIFPRQTSLEEMQQIIQDQPGLEYEAFVLNEKCHFTGAYCNSLHCDELCHGCQIPYQLVETEPGREPAREHAIPEETLDVPGATGCGLCNLWQFRQMGITHLKLVSRGNDTESTLADIRLLKRGLEILGQASSEDAFIHQMMQELFPEGCSRNCYQHAYWTLK